MSEASGRPAGPLLPTVAFLAARERVLLALIGAVLMAVVALALVRGYDPDEFEHLQFAWLVHTGKVPYRDFFEHHTPLWHLLIAPVLGLFDVTRAASGWQALTLLRAIALATGLAVLAMTWLLARRLFGVPSALLAVALLLTHSIAINKLIEVRPDQLALLGVLAGSYALLRAFESMDGRRLAWLALAGLAAGASIMANQKALFAIPGFGIAYAALCWRRTSFRACLAGMLAVAVGASVAVLPVLAWFQAQGALGDFVYHNFILNVGYPRYYRGALLRWMKWTLLVDTLFWALAIAGTLRLGLPLLAGRGKRLVWVVLGPLATLSVGFVVIPVSQRQYFFFMLPFAAIPAAVEAERVGTWVATWRFRTWRFRQATLALPAVLALYAILHVALELRTRDPLPLQKLAYVLQTPPDATIMAGWLEPGLALRQPAWRFLYVYGERRELLERTGWPGLHEGLRDGTIRPLVIDYDDDMRAMPTEFNDFVKAHYAPVGIGDLWRRID